MKKITILGATGYTGRIICGLLNAKKISFSIAGKVPEKLDTLQKQNSFCQNIFVTDVFDQNSIKNLLDKTDILVNCVGPFNYYAKSLLEEVSKRKIIYLDITGEQDIILRSYKNLQEVAKLSHATIIHSSSFESCLADMLASKICNSETSYEDISSFYHVSSIKTSPGTKLTIRLSKNVSHYILKDDELKNALPRCEQKKIFIDKRFSDFAAIFTPYPEVIFWNELYHPRNAGTYTMVKKEDLLFFGAGEGPSTNSDMIVTSHKKSVKPGPDLLERESSDFLICVQAIDNKYNVKKIILEGKDPYGLTGLIILVSIESLLKSPPSYGVLSPAEAFSPDKFLDELQKLTQLEIHE